MSDRIPTVETYRGVGVHDEQPSERIEHVVKPEIDQVHGMADVDALVKFAGAVHNCPEARLLAAAKIEALWELASDERRPRPTVDLDKLRAVVAGLDSVAWRSPTYYCSDLDVLPTDGGPVRREHDKYGEILGPSSPGTNKFRPALA